jgi:hypothetical protein
MVNARLQTLLGLIVLALVVGLGSGPAAADQKADPPPKAPIVLPKDPKAAVLTYDPGANGFIRKGPPPYLLIQADGSVIVTNVFDGARKEGKLTPDQLQELLRFVLRDNDFFNVTAARIADEIKAAQMASGIAIALGGVGTSVISVQADGKQHEVSYRGAAEYLRVYPQARTLGQYVAVEKRLAELGQSVQKGK